MTVTPDETNRIRALKLLEMQRQAMLMYTSCGWFFDELSGIETVQVIQYAGRAVQLAEELFESEIEAPFIEKLAAAKSNIPRHRDGRHIYEKWVKPSSVDLKKAASHYAISSFFEDYAETVSIYCYFIENLDNRSAEAGKAKIAVGRAQLTSQVTRETAQFHYAVFHMGDHSISCGISRFDEKAYPRMAEEVIGVFDKNDIPGVFRCFGKYFQDSIYSLISLFRDEQRKVLNTILEATTTDTLAMYRQLYDNHVSLMRFINDSSSRIPKALYVAGDIVVNSDLNHEFDREEFDYDAIHNLIEDAERAGIALDAETLEFTLRNRLEQLARKFQAAPDDVDLLDQLAQGVELAVGLPFLVRFQEVQNIHYTLGQKKYDDFRARADEGDDEARQWVATFLRLAEILKIRPPMD